MANEDQLKILKQGVEVWNAWRAEHSEEEIDLGKADLGRARLGRANLKEANLGGAYLFGADLREADLREANLRGAYLGEANLTEANLLGAYLFGAILRKASLGRADLFGADLFGADLFGADLGRADLFGADLFGADLAWTNLVQTTLCDANITGATLYGAARDDWIIDRIKCEYVFWDNKPSFCNFETKTFDREKVRQWLKDHRFPKDRDFRPGEFEELYTGVKTKLLWECEHGHQWEMTPQKIVRGQWCRVCRQQERTR